MTDNVMRHRNHTVDQLHWDAGWSPSGATDLLLDEDLAAIAGSGLYKRV